MAPQSHDRDEDVFLEKPADFRLEEVEVRLIPPMERLRWDAVMNKHHYLRFDRFAGQGLRYVVTWRGQWLALSGWQGGAFKCKPRDRWIGWKQIDQFRRLDLIANNTRFLVLANPGVFWNLASFFLSTMTRRLAADWQKIYGHGVLIAETFCDPEQFAGTMYQASGWQMLGETKGYARSNGRYTDPHNKPKQIWVRTLRRDAQKLLANPAPLPLAVKPLSGPDQVTRDPELMRSLYAELAAIPDYRRAQGRKHTVACVLTIHLLATMANMKGCLAAAQFAKALSQDELEAVGAWKNPKTGLYEPVAKSTLHRVVQSVDPEALEAVLHRYAQTRIPLARALAGDGKRIRGANRNGDGHHETVTLVDHTSGAPVAMLGFADKGGELAALHDLLERIDIQDKIITLDALHTVRNTARRILSGDADYVMAVKGNAPETFKHLDLIDWKQVRDGHYAEEPTKAHGRLEQRTIDVMTPLPKAINYPGVRQIARVQRSREILKLEGQTPSNETAYLITSLSASEASPADLLALNRGHWSVESHHRQRDTTFGEDACMTRTGNGPLNRASLNSIALAVVFTNQFEGEKSLAETLRRFQLRPRDAIRAVCEPSPDPIN